jgi:hypothetical protein
MILNLPGFNGIIMNGIQPSELTERLSGSGVVGGSRLYRGRVGAEASDAALVLNASRETSVGLEGHALETKLAPRPAIEVVFPVSADAKISAPVVGGIAVNVIDDHALGNVPDDLVLDVDVLDGSVADLASDKQPALIVADGAPRLVLVTQPIGLVDQEVVAVKGDAHLVPPPKQFEVIRRDENFIPVGSVAAKLVRELAFGEIQKSFAKRESAKDNRCQDAGEAKCLLG